MAAQNLERLAGMLHPLERKVLPHLEDTGTADRLADASGLQEVEVVRALQWLGNKGCLTVGTDEVEELVVSEKGKRAHEDGLPEAVAWRALEKEKELRFDQLAGYLPVYDKDALGSVLGYLKSLHVPQITTADGKPAFKLIGSMTFREPPAAAALAAAAAADWRLPLTDKNRDAAKDVVKRKGYGEVRKRRIKTYALTPLGKALRGQKLTDYADGITVEDLKTGAWRKKKYRAYDVTINVPAAAPGKAHFVNEAIDYIKQVWLELGFQEMEGPLVHTAFWDLDVLFVPQDHPAREMQDTFYLKDPARAPIAERDVYAKVKTVHENGGDTGSTGWRYAFSKEESERLMLRTHTTVLSAMTLDAIRRGEKQMPGKYFAVGRNFRNEAVDWKHLFELTQVEGIVVDPDADFSHLLGYLTLFFRKLGYEKVRIRPAHFPYTEPSVEVDGWHPVKKQWVELGGAGMFRPEVTKTLIGKETPVLAWGLGMERSISEYFGITDIRQLYENDVKQLRSIRKWVK